MLRALGAHSHNESPVTISISFNPAGVTTLADNSFVYSSGNVLLSRSCNDSSLLWDYSFSGTDNDYSFLVSVTSGDNAVYANMYWPGALCRMSGSEICSRFAIRTG